MWSFVMAHQLIFGAVGMWLVGNAVSAMPTPKSDSSAFYDWFFKFMQPVGAAIPRLLAVYSPSTLTAVTGQSTAPTKPNSGSGGQ